MNISEFPKGENPKYWSVGKHKCPNGHGYLWETTSGSVDMYQQQGSLCGVKRKCGTCNYEIVL